MLSSSGMRWVGVVHLGAVLFAALLAAPPARADKVDKLSAQLRSADFRIRTQAALALGASKSERAVKALCRGLGDPATSVRAASAAALGRLALGGDACLKKRLSSESSGNVKTSIRKALVRLDEAQGAPAFSEAEITADTKVYIAIGKTADKSGRKGTEIDAMVREAMIKAASGIDGFAASPDGKGPGAKARKLLGKYKKVRAFYLAPRVKEPEYANGTLIVRVEVAIFSYPGKALKGSLPVKLTQQDVSSRNQASEDELITMAAERVVEKFAQNVERID